jgi:tRNA 2-thiouridine synthesizing protein A
MPRLGPKIVARKTSVTTMQANKELDARGLNCPLPILKAKKALADMLSGEVLKIVATDPGSMRDFQAFAKQTGNDLLKQDSGEKEFTHYLKRR